MSLHLVAAPAAEPEDLTEQLPRCKACGTRIRPHRTTEAEFPGTAAGWGNSQCRICDYLAAGKDPADRFISVERVGYLASLRTGIETERQSRGIPAEGTRAGRVPLTDFLKQIS